MPARPMPNFMLKVLLGVLILCHMVASVTMQLGFSLPDGVTLPKWIPSRTMEHLAELHVLDEASNKVLTRQALRWLLRKGATLYPLRTHSLYSKDVNAPRATFNDPLFPRQWYLWNQRLPGHDLNLLPVWSRGIKGKGVVVSLIDDGVDYEHDDLKESFRRDLSYDYNESKLLPVPRKSRNDFHGTRCAGQIASKANNGICGVGIAPEAQISAIRILSGTISSTNEAAAVVHRYHENLIYSCSWGPADDGKAMDAPDKLVLRNFIDGLVRGRNGRGSIYVFAAGNGKNVDDCNYDGYANGMFALTVGAVDVNDKSPPYMESCSAQLVCAYSSNQEHLIATTELGNKCTTRHGGTSAAAPMVAGIVALVLSARPDLSWRDVRHIFVSSAMPFGVDKDSGWITNGVGKRYHSKFGFGKVDADKIVTTALRWKPVPRPVVRSLPLKQVDLPITKKVAATDSISIDSRTHELATTGDIGFLENVTVKLYISHSRRGDLVVRLSSPAGTTITLAMPRPLDSSRAGFDGWTMMTPAFWGESLEGEWTLTVKNTRGADSSGTLIKYRITFWGGAAPHVHETDEQYATMFLNDYYPPNANYFVDKPGLWHSPPRRSQIGRSVASGIHKHTVFLCVVLFILGSSLACILWAIWGLRAQLTGYRELLLADSKLTCELVNMAPK